MDQFVNYICWTCGTQFPASLKPPEHCPICEDERQYVGPNGQLWTTMGELQENHHNKIKILEPNLTGVGMVPVFSIGQRALLVHTEAGNVLWDTIPLLDEMTITTVNALAQP